jgi:hypothetical protein
MVNDIMNATSQASDVTKSKCNENYKQGNLPKLMEPGGNFVQAPAEYLKRCVEGGVP